MKLSTETKVGISAVLAFAFFLWGINFLKGRNILRSGNTYYVLYENVAGLKEADPVIINGYTVGQVDEINFYSHQDHGLIVALNIRKDVKIPKGSLARINVGMLSTNTIELIPDYANKHFFEHEDTINGELAPELTELLKKEIDPIKTKTESLLSALDSLVTEVFDHETRTNLKHTFDHIEETTGMISAEKQQFQNSMDSLYALIETLARNKENIHNAIHNFEAISDSLSEAEIKSTIYQTQSSIARLNNILTKIDSAEGSLGLLVNDDSLYVHLDESSKNLSLLLEDLRLNPQSYVHFSLFGSNKNNKK